MAVYEFYTELLVAMLCCSYLFMCDFDSHHLIAPRKHCRGPFDCHGDPGQGYEESRWNDHKEEPIGASFFLPQVCLLL